MRPRCCLYGVSEMRGKLPGESEFAEYANVRVEEFSFDFPEDAAKTNRDLRTGYFSWTPADNKENAPPTHSRRDATLPRGPSLPDGVEWHEGGAPFVSARPDVEVSRTPDTGGDAEHVFLCNYLAQTYVTMRELRANEVNARSAIGKDWDASRHKEVDAWLDFGAGKVVKRMHYRAARVLKTRWVYTVKPDGRKKSRLCVRGDIEKRQLTKLGKLPSHESWAPSREADRMYYGITAEKKWQTKSSDYPNAFLQSDADKLEREILLDLPVEARAYLEMKDDEVFLLYKNAYGTIDAPRAWQRTLQQEYTSKGFKIHPTIPTLFCLYNDESGELEGHSKVHMDDSEYAGGTERFHKLMQSIQTRFKVPDEKIDVGKYTLCGRQIEQDPKTMEITVSLSKYAEMIEQIPTRRSRDPDDPISDQEATEVMRVVGQAIWYQSNAAPHVSFRTSMLATMKAQKRYACILSANELVAYIHKHKNWFLKYVQVAHGILENLRVLSFCDASKSTVDKHDWTLPLDKMRLKGFAGRAFCFVDVTSVRNQSIKANLVNHRASKLDRVCCAPSSAETLAGVKCAYEGMALARDLALWIGGPEAFSDAHAVLQYTDSENLVENIRSDFPRPIDTLLVPDLLAMREHIEAERIALRWIDTRIMIADPLTKEFDGHPPLWNLCHRNTMELVYTGDKRKYPKHLSSWEPAWSLQVIGAGWNVAHRRMAH